MFKFPSLYILFFVVSWTYVSANTEIRNFEAIERQGIVTPQTSKWPTLRPSANEGEWSLELAPVEISLDTESPESDPKSNPREMWVVLDLDQEEWRIYSKFTLRVSWPASSPATFFMHIYTPESLLTVIPEYQHSSTTGQIAHTSKVKTTRRMYAHIRVVETDIPASVFPQRVTFRVILEPLIMGVLPASVQPTVLALVLVTSLAVLAVPWINRCLERLAQKATEATKSKRE